MQRFIAFTEDELTDLLIRSARLGARQAIDSLATPDVMTKEQVAKYLKKSVATISRLMKGGMPFEKRPGEHPRFYKSDVDNWYKSRDAGL